MLSFRVRFVFIVAAVTLISKLLCAAPSLTTIQDLLYKADGTKFTGILQITWTSFTAGDTSNIPTQSVTSQVNNGYLHVLLVPTTNAASPAVYNVIYNSDGKVQFTETWVVPPSTSPLRVADVRTSRSAGSASALSQPQISDVSGLRTELSIRPTMGSGYAPARAAVIDGSGGLSGASGNLSDCVHVDGTSGPCGTNGGSSPPPPPTPTVFFADAETPGGAVDGVNATFQLASAPSPAPSLEVYRNGLALQRSVDFNVSGTAVTFLSGSVPQPGDALQAFYRTGSGTYFATSFADAETPSGQINGSNVTFGLLNAPSPTTSLELYRNGIALQRGVDFNISGATVTFLSGSVPQPGDILQAFYRTASSTTSSGSFADAETPSGTINGVNATFGLANPPSPATSLEMFRNGLALQRSVDFNISGSTVTFVAGSIPQPGDVIHAFYRFAASGTAGALSVPSLSSSVPSCTTYTLGNNGTNWSISINGVPAAAGPAIAASNAQDIPLFDLPAKGTITGIREKTSTAWGGGGFTALGLSIGDSVGGPGFYTSSGYDLMAAPSNTNFLSTQLFKSATDAGSTVIAHLTSNAALNSAPLAGTVDIAVCWVTLP